MTIEEIREQLFLLQDRSYQRFQSKLIPSIDPDTMIGVRTPQLKKMAGNLLKDGSYKTFFRVLPHSYFEENQIHGFLIAGIKDMEECVKELNRFLPYVNNWATCDQLTPKIFKTHKEELLKEIPLWFEAKEEYTVRFGIKMMMDHFLEKDFSLKYPQIISKIQRQEYYIRMMVAWYFATALAKQYHLILPFFTEKRLEVWVHNKALQKAVESQCISGKKKEYLKTLKRKSKNCL